MVLDSSTPYLIALVRQTCSRTQNLVSKRLHQRNKGSFTHNSSLFNPLARHSYRIPSQNPPTAVLPTSRLTAKDYLPITKSSPMPKALQKSRMPRFQSPALEQLPAVTISNAELSSASFCLGQLGYDGLSDAFHRGSIVSCTADGPKLGHGRFFT